MDPQALGSALQKVFPELSLSSVTPTLVVDGKALQGSKNKKGEGPAVHVGEVWCEGAQRSLAQARVEGREDETLVGLLEHLELKELSGGLLVGDAGFLYPQVAQPSSRPGKGGSTS